MVQDSASGRSLIRITTHIHLVFRCMNKKLERIDNSVTYTNVHVVASSFCLLQKRVDGVMVPAKNGNNEICYQCFLESSIHCL